MNIWIFLWVVCLWYVWEMFPLSFGLVMVHTVAPLANLHDMDMESFIWCQKTNFPETWHSLCGRGSMMFWGWVQDIWSLCSLRESCVLSSRSSAFLRTSQICHSGALSVDEVNALQRRAECPVWDFSTASLPLVDGLILLDFFQADHQCALEQLAVEV